MFDWFVAWLNANGVIGTVAIVLAGGLAFYGLVRFLISIFKPTPPPVIKYPRPPKQEEPPEVPKPEESHL